MSHLQALQIPAIWLGLFALGVAISAILIPLLIRWQRRAALGQQIYEDGPSSHAVKQGTPTMGGIALVIAAALGVYLSIWPFRTNEYSIQILPLLYLVVAAGAVGFIDDYLIVVRRRPLGLRARAKFGLLLVLAICFVWYESTLPSTFPSNHSALWFGGIVHLPAWLWWVLSVGAIVGTANAVNLTDGLDGLAAGTAIPVLIFLALFSDAVLMLPLVGACAGFLYFNRHPARIFMGDTGSLALGAFIGGVAVHYGLVLLLPLAGIVFVIEALSVIIQVASFQTTGKRVFRMTPLHHHFELLGWKESRVSASFAAASWIAALIIIAAGITLHVALGAGALHAE
jgi:phospho-N-acetylmuramoyl-pentapeptide-transferase